MKKTKLLLVALLVLLCGCMLCSCIFEDEPPTQGGSSNALNEPVRVEEFGDEPYHIYYTSNGDGTCYVSDVTTNPDNTEDFTLVIPEQSPDGDTVTAIYTGIGSYESAFDNLPVLLTEEAFERLLEPVEDKQEHAYHRFRAFYDRFALEDAKSEKSKQNMIEQLPLVQVAILYRLDPNSSYEDMKFLSEFLTEKAGYTAQHKNSDEQEILALAGNYAQPKDKYAALHLLYDRDVSHLTAIELPSTIQTMTPDPNSWGSMDINPFTLCDQLSNISVSADNAKYHSIDNCLIITATKTMIVGCQTSKIPSGGEVAAIHVYAFSGCTSLTDITIPEGVIDISIEAFSGCAGLKSVVIPSSARRIAHRAFFGCSSLTSVTISNGITHIEEEAFANCNALTNVTLPGSVLVIDKNAFAGCDNLTSIRFDGTWDQFNAVEKHTDWLGGLPIQFVTCTDREYWFEMIT